MESLEFLKARKKSVTNIGQITKAMELVAATRMRRSQEIALASRPYVTVALELLKKLEQKPLQSIPILLQKREVKKRLIVLIASDKGLAGAFNSNVFRLFENDNLNGGVENLYAAVGQRAIDYLKRNSYETQNTFHHYGDFTTLDEVAPLTKYLIEGYQKEEWDEVVVYSTHFVNALRQTVMKQTVLPVKESDLKEIIMTIAPSSGRYSDIQTNVENGKIEEHIIEPSPTEALEALLPHLVKMRIYHLLLEANASEHSARRLAMKNATDNADSLKEELTLLYNKSRQAVITREIIEIAGSTELLSS